MDSNLLDPFPAAGSREHQTPSAHRRAPRVVRVNNGGVPSSERHLREALSQFLTGGGITRRVRKEIVESWRRVASRGLQPDRFEPPYDGDLEQGGRLERAAAPVLDQLGDDLAGTGTSLLLTDERAHVVDRRVTDPVLRTRLDDILLAPGFYYDEGGAGTNGIGSSLAKGAPALVNGGEHFADALTEMACAGAPVTDPRNGQVLGIVDITVRVTSANSLMLPFAKRAAWEIEQRLLDGASAIERVLHERFLRARRRAKGPLALVSEYMMMTNTAAARIVDDADRMPLWDWASRIIATGGRGSRNVTLANGRMLTAECERVEDGGITVGALIRLRVPGAGPSGAERSGSQGARPVCGWGSLTGSERSVADLVAEGLTNREVATRLFLSPHTVDAHLRHIYRKLGIGSRVALARMAPDNGEELTPVGGG